MAKKKASKGKTAAGNKIKCPVCACIVNVKITKHDSMSVYPCASCGETIEAQKCCIVCDFGKKTLSKA
jgi:hypothetical protein